MHVTTLTGQTPSFDSCNHLPSGIREGWVTAKTNLSACALIKWQRETQARGYSPLYKSVDKPCAPKPLATRKAKAVSPVVQYKTRRTTEPLRDAAISGGRSTSPDAKQG